MPTSPYFIEDFPDFRVDISCNNVILFVAAFYANKYIFFKEEQQ